MSARGHGVRPSLHTCPTPPAAPPPRRGPPAGRCRLATQASSWWRRRSRGAAPFAALVAVAVAVAGAALGGCAHRPEALPADASLLVAADDPAALVYVDDAIIGRAAELAAHPLPLRSGQHRLEVRAEGKLTAYRDVTLRPGDNATLAIRLRPDLDATDTD